MHGLDLLGAGDGLRNQFVIIQVTHVDGAVLRQKLKDSNTWPGIAGLAVYVTDGIPKAAVDIALPIAVQKLKEYGIDAKITAADAPPVQGRRPVSEFFPGLAVGAGVVGVGCAVGWAAWRLLFQKLLVGGK